MTRSARRPESRRLPVCQGVFRAQSKRASRLDLVSLLKIDRKRSAAVHRLDMRSHRRSRTFDVVRRHSLENLLMLRDGNLGVRDTGLSEEAEALTKYWKRAQGLK